MAKRTIVKVNEMTWQEDQKWVARPCGGCSKPTRGRIDKKPVCMDCGLKRMMPAISAVAGMFREIFR